MIKEQRIELKTESEKTANFIVLLGRCLAVWRSQTTFLFNFSSITCLQTVKVVLWNKNYSYTYKFIYNFVHIR